MSSIYYGMFLKVQKKVAYNRIATIIIIFATSMRIILAALGWPPTNSDEGVMAIMATNIAYRGATPLMFYGQDYMGTIEAYLGAGFFHLFGGPSIFALRLGVILQVTLFFICMYFLARLIFSKSLAIVMLLILSLGSIPVLTRQMIATGGSSQTLFFGSFAFLVATQLSITYKKHTSLNTKLKRFAGYAVWGLAAGLGIWSDMVVLPFLVMAGFLLLLFCWRELLVWGWLIVLSCIAIGMLPLILYDHRRGLNSWQILLNLAHGSNAVAPQTLPGILHNITSTILISIPTATGNPFCPVDELRFLSDNTPPSLPCTLIQASWGGGYLLLLVCALGVTSYALWQMKCWLKKPADIDLQQMRVRYIARLLLLGGAALAICVYALSSGPVDQPGYHARYLVSLLIATPGLIFPLWNAATQLRPAHVFEHLKAYTCRVLLILVYVLFLIATMIGFSEVPAARVASQQRQDLIDNLTRIGVTHFYTEYWSCYNLIFSSHEHITCAILKSDLQPTNNRIPGYFDLVKADSHAAYVLPLNSDLLPANYQDLPAVERKFAQAGPGKYRRYEFDGYVVYQPVS